MMTFVFIGIIFLILAVLFGAWWLYTNITSIDTNIHDLQHDKYSRLTNRLENIKTTISSSKNELSSTIRNSDSSIKNHVTTENSALRQMIMAQFSNQTSKLVEDVGKNRQSLSNLTSIVHDFRIQTSNGLNEGSIKMGELSSSISKSIFDSANRTNGFIQNLKSDENQHSTAILAGIDMVVRNVTEFNKSIERNIRLLEENDEKHTNQLNVAINSLSTSIKQHKENITSLCNQILDTEKELHKKTKSSFDSMNDQLSKYQSQLKQIDLLYDNLQKLFAKILGEEEKISKQEASLASMVSRHSQIFEITSEMNNTSKEILEFMKLYLIQSTLDNFKK